MHSTMMFSTLLTKYRVKMYHCKSDEAVFKVLTTFKEIKELGNKKSRHWDLYAKSDASIGFNKKPQNVVFL